MNKQNKGKNWIEVSIVNTNCQDISTQEYFEELFSENILVLNSKDNSIYFFSTYVKLTPQEYQFLLKILKQNGRGIRAERLMISIGAKCINSKHTLLDYSYAITKHIKDKIIKAFNKRKYMSTSEARVKCALKKAKNKKRVLYLQEDMKKREQKRLTNFKNRTHYVIPDLENVDWPAYQNYDKVNIEPDKENQNISLIDYQDNTQGVDLAIYIENLIDYKNGLYRAFYPFSVKKYKHIKSQ